MKGLEKGPFSTEDSAIRWVASRLEQHVSSIAEIDDATQRALQEADLREGKQEEAAAAGADWRNAGRTDAELAKEDELEMQQLREEQERRRVEKELEEQRARAEAEEAGVDRPLSRAERQELRRQQAEADKQ